MKNTIIAVLLFLLISAIRVASGQSPSFSHKSNGQLEPAEALARAKALWKGQVGKVEKNWEKLMHEKVKAEYDSILGPYFAVSQVPEFNSSYLIFFVKNNGAVVGQAFVDGYGEKANDEILIFPKAKGPDYKTFILDSSSVEQRFHQSCQKKLIFSQMVFPAKFIRLLFITYLPAVWWLMDEDGSCYYMNFSGNIFSFKDLMEMKNKRTEGMRIINGSNPADSSIEGGKK
jgi:hypothetical protein